MDDDPVGSLQLFLTHLTVGHPRLGIRHEASYRFCHTLDAGHMIVNEIYLTTTFHLSLDGLFDETVVVFRNISNDGTSVLGRRRNDADVPNPGK